MTMYRMCSLTWMPNARNRGIDQVIGSRMGPDPRRLLTRGTPDESGWRNDSSGRGEGERGAARGFARSRERPRSFIGGEQRQLHRERGPLAQDALDPDAPLVLLDDLPADAQ